MKQLLAITVAAILGCLGSVPAGEVVKINFATNQPATHVVGPAYQGLVNELNEKGGGRIVARAFFSEQLGTEKEIVDLTANNINDVLCSPGPSEISTRFASLQLFDCPYMFRSPRHMLNFANGEASRKMWDAVAEATNLRVLGTYYFGTRHLTTNNLEVKAPADLAGFKLRVVDSPITLATGRALGANPTPLAYGELYLGLQQGVVNGQENPLANILAMKFYEVQNRLILTGHVTASVCFVISDSKWRSLPEDTRKIIQTAVNNAVDAASNAIISKEEAQIAELESRGMKVIRPNVEAFRANAASVADKYKGGWIDGLYELVQSVDG